VPPLRDRLYERIFREGPISFRDFMEAALYDPEEGYYTRGAPIGEPGDFVTSPFVSPAFSAAIARKFAEDAERLTGELEFVEVGAGDGRFLEDFALALAAQNPEVSKRVRLTAVERSRAARESLGKRKIASAPQVLASVDEIAPSSVTGWIFSNELYDALPVARVVGCPGGLEELRVGIEGGRFAWTRDPAPEALGGYLASFGIRLEPEQVGEISLAAAPLHRNLARALKRGRLVVFDYGHRASVLYHPLARRQGTLAVHSAGRRGGDPLSRPGEVDLTAHVNWDDLARAGEGEGLTIQGVFRQGRYLTEAGLLDFVRNDQEKWRAYRLLDPEGMGEEISVLVQSRGM